MVCARKRGGAAGTQLVVDLLRLAVLRLRGALRARDSGRCAVLRLDRRPMLPMRAVRRRARAQRLRGNAHQFFFVFGCERRQFVRVVVAKLAQPAACAAGQSVEWAVYSNTRSDAWTGSKKAKKATNSYLAF